MKAKATKSIFCNLSMAVALMFLTNPAQSEVIEVQSIAPPLTGAAKSSHLPSLAEDIFSNQITIPIVSMLEVTTAEQNAAEERAREDYSDIESPPPRIGFVRQFPGGSLAMTDQALTVPGKEGTDVTLLSIQSPGAHGLRLRLRVPKIEPGELICFGWSDENLVSHDLADDRENFPAGEYWTSSLPGEKVFIEAAPGVAQGLTILEILHYDHPPLLSGAFNPKDGKRIQPCSEDVMCFGDPPVNTLARDAVGRMNFVSNGNSYICTGTILNDANELSYIPWFLTAYHCLHTQTEVNSLEVVWYWQRDSCNGSQPDFWTLPRNVGGTLLAASPTFSGNDMCFIELEGAAQTPLSGWTTGDPEGNEHGIHNPGGALKSVTFFNGTANPICEPDLPESRFHYFTPHLGITEGGSSGSGLFNSDGMLFGQLFGTCSSTGQEPSCSTLGLFNNVYGKFSYSYPMLESFLTPGVWVEFGYGGSERGSFAMPYNTFSEGLTNVPSGGRLNIKNGGTTSWTGTISKSMEIVSWNGTTIIGNGQ